LLEASIAARARWIEAGAFGSPTGGLIAHILQTDRPADRFREQCRVHRAITGIVAAV
jgi:hypothetical protein